MDLRDDELMAQAQGGDAKALEALLVRHAPRLHRFAMKMCREPEDAQDVLQESMLAAARGVSGFRGASSVPTWLYAIARSFCIKKRRTSKFAPAREESLEAREVRDRADPGVGPEEIAAAHELERELDRAIAALEPASREVLVLRDVEGLSAIEVAEILGLSVDAVKSRLHRARAAVRAWMVPLLGYGADQPARSPECPDVIDLFSRYVEDDISAATCAQMQSHVDGCERCRNACDALKETLSLCRREGGKDVPPEVQAQVRQALRDLVRP